MNDRLVSSIEWQLAIIRNKDAAWPIVELPRAEWQQIIAALRRGPDVDVEAAWISARALTAGIYGGLSRLLESYVKPCSEKCNHANCPLLRDLYKLRDKHRAEYANSPPSGEMVMGLRVVVNPDVPADEVWITDVHGKRLGTIVNLVAAEAEGRKS